MTMPEEGPLIAISNTGPLISAFQSDCFHLMTTLLGVIHTTTACIAELSRHGYEDALVEAGSNLISHVLTPTEIQTANQVAQQIAAYPAAKDREPEAHSGEAEAIVLAQRAEFSGAVLLLDELAAREVARKMGVLLTGFAGVLLVAVDKGLLTAEGVRECLQRCRHEGTHYSDSFIRQIYLAAKGR